MWLTESQSSLETFQSQWLIDWESILYTMVDWLRVNYLPTQMTNTQQMCLFQLPGSIVATIISKYLPLRDIGSFDSATSDKESRRILLGLFATPEFVIEGHRDFGESSSKIGLSDANNDYWTFQESFVPWIFKRQISIRKLKIYKIVLPIGISNTNAILDNLQSFTLDTCYNLTQRHLPNLFHLTNLRSLRLGHSTKLNDGFIDKLSRGFSLLEHLDLSYFEKITIKTIGNLWWPPR